MDWSYGFTGSSIEIQGGPASAGAASNADKAAARPRQRMRDNMGILLETGCLSDAGRAGKVQCTSHVIRHTSEPPCDVRCATCDVQSPRPSRPRIYVANPLEDRLAPRDPANGVPVGLEHRS